MKSIFLTYNQGSGVGKNTALRMQTISNLYGLSVFLPARTAAYQAPITEETMRRIQASTFMVSFVLEELTPEMQGELSYAIQCSKPIVVLYHPGVGRTLDFKGYHNYKEVEIDYDNSEQTLHEVATFLDGIPVAPSPQTPPKKTSNAGTAIVGIGLGLLALWALTRD